MTTQEMWLRPPRSPTIVGSAVETIVWSSAAISITSIRPVNTSRTLGGLPSRPAIARDASAVGTGARLGASERRRSPLVAAPDVYQDSPY